MIEEPTLFDTQLIGLYIIGLALVGFLGECGRGAEVWSKGLQWPACLYRGLSRAE